ncbi:kunitz-type serine protease inhibitor A-like [Battus philenor]|uniref:kunitz-type serine protease inhibitor A-like n=1 Tax=Battus philenor TaxID=42288 RepID=UPI0035CE9082
MYMRMHCVVAIVVLLVYFSVSYKADNNVTLSSASVRQGTMPKPTKKYKSINVKTTGNEITTNSRLSYISGRKFSFDNIWSWDYWCQLQPKTGNCTKSLLRYYYDTQLDQCVNFTYSGCDGNSNNFDSQSKCEQNCNGAYSITVKEDKANYCALQPDVGICLALETVYYYDINVGECKEFQYGGCGGNGNRFLTKKSCMRDCNES